MSKLVFRKCVDTTLTITPLPGYSVGDVLQMLRSGRAKWYESMIIDERENKPIAKVDEIRETDWDIWNMKV